MLGSTRENWPVYIPRAAAIGASLVVVDAIGIVLGDWKLWMRAQGLSDRTITERLAVVTRLLATSTPFTVSEIDIQRFLARPVSASTKATYHADIRAFCAWMQRTGRREDNPADRTPRPRRPKGTPRPVSDGQLHAILACANRHRTRAYVMLGAYAGLRVHEIAKIAGRDIGGGMLTVTGKGGKTATVPLHHALEPLAAVMPDGYWFPSRTAPHVAGAAVSQAISDCMRRAHVPATPHALRHFYATELVRAGVNLRIVQTLMRHESPATTAIYAQVDLGQMRAAIDLLEAA